MNGMKKILALCLILALCCTGIFSVFAADEGSVNGLKFFYEDFSDETLYPLGAELVTGGYNLNSVFTANNHPWTVENVNSGGVFITDEMPGNGRVISHNGWGTTGETVTQTLEFDRITGDSNNIATLQFDYTPNHFVKDIVEEWGSWGYNIGFSISFFDGNKKAIYLEHRIETDWIHALVPHMATDPNDGGTLNWDTYFYGTDNVGWKTFVLTLNFSTQMVDISCYPLGDTEAVPQTLSYAFVEWGISGIDKMVVHTPGNRNSVAYFTNIYAVDGTDVGIANSRDSEGVVTGDMVTISGETYKRFEGKSVTLMLIDSTASLSTITDAGIGHIAQTTIQSDGSYEFNFKFDGFTYGAGNVVDNYVFYINLEGTDLTPSVTKAYVEPKMLCVDLSVAPGSAVVKLDVSSENRIKLPNSGNYTLFLAFYDGIKLLDVAVGAAKPLPNGAFNDYTLSKTVPQKTTMVKAFIWRDGLTIEPLETDASIAVQ